MAQDGQEIGSENALRKREKRAADQAKKAANNRAKKSIRDKIKEEKEIAAQVS